MGTLYAVSDVQVKIKEPIFAAKPESEQHIVGL